MAQAPLRRTRQGTVVFEWFLAVPKARGGRD